MSSITIHDKHFVPYLTNEELQKVIKDLAEKVYEDYKDEVPVFIGVLNGVFMFFSDFMKYYPGRCEVAFLQVSSYNGGLQSTGIVYKKMDLTKDVEGRHIILMEDIVDTGRTLKALIENLKGRNVASVACASLVDKPETRVVDVEADYIGIVSPNEFLVGFGLDYDERYRNLPYIGVLKEEIYS